MNYNSLTIKSLLKSSRMGLLPLSDDIPLESMESCPACQSKLEPFCLLRSGKGKKIRLGYCSNCRYRGYMDRPTRDWVTHYYSTEWDQEFIRTPEMMLKDVELPKGEIKGSRRGAYLAARDLKVSKEKAVCDIGSGYGQVMKNFELAGFKKVVGIENSAHRAKLVQEVFGFSVIHGEFGSVEVEEKLKSFSPFGIMFSHHVFEHVYDPEAVVHSLSHLQEEGDYAVFAMPNADGEHINYTTLYLPHLHNFTKEALETLFNRFGYELRTDHSATALSMVLVFQKTKEARPKLDKSHRGEEDLRRRLSRGLCLKDYSESGLYAWKWEQDADGGDRAEVKLLSKNLWLARFKWWFWQARAYLKSRIFKRVTAYHVFLVSPRQAGNGGLQEIWFENKILLIIK